MKRRPNEDLRSAPAGVVLGFQPVRELLRSRPQQVLCVIVSQAKTRPRTQEITKLCERARIELRHVPRDEIDRVAAEHADTNDETAVHNGFAALLAAVPSRDVERDDSLIVLVEDVQDPRNLGALLRVCEATGVGRVLIRDRGSAPMTAVVEKASAGAVSWLDIERYTNTAQQIEAHKKNEYWVYGSDSEGEAPWNVDLTGPVVLCIGGEGTGLRHRTKTLCDGLLGLPMLGQIDSLNLATAASALLYEIVRQRKASTAS